jgi:hypothetical protein
MGIMDFSVAIGGATSALVGGEIYGLAGLGALGLVGMALTLAPFLAGLRLNESSVDVYEVTGPESSSESSGSRVMSP